MGESVSICGGGAINISVFLHIYSARGRGEASYGASEQNITRLIINRIVPG